MIELSNVSKTYPGDPPHQAIAGINLSVKPKEIFGIIGRSGAGKSTLVRMVNLLELPTTGTISVNGVNLLTLNEQQLRQQRHQIGMIFQHFNLLSSRTVFDNVAFPLEIVGKSKVEIEQKVTSLLELVGLSDRQHYYPHQLSGGQKQRVAIARALASDPKVLLSDEATSSLDPETTVSILQLLKRINRELGVTILLITHEMEVIKQICNRVAILDKGGIVELKSTVDLFSKPETEVAKRLTRSALHIELPSHIESKLAKAAQPNHVPVVRLTFVGEQVEQPILSAVSEQCGVKINILRATLERVQDTPLGVTVCELMGVETQIAQALALLQQKQIGVEVYGYVPVAA